MALNTIDKLQFLSFIIVKFLQEYIFLHIFLICAHINLEVKFSRI